MAIPTKQAILDWIADNPTETSKRDIARAFGVKGAERIDLKRMLKELEAEGHLAKRKKSYNDPNVLPPVAVLKVLGPDDNGDLFAAPLEWHGEGDEPRILMSLGANDPALGEGDRLLARLTEVREEDHSHTGRLIRKIGSGPQRVLGVFRKTPEGGRIMPIDKGEAKEWLVSRADTEGAKEGELVEAVQVGPKGRMGLARARIQSRLGDPTQPKAVSLIAIQQHGIPNRFPDEVMEEAEAAKPAPLGKREDLRDLPFVTIDPADARDHDDACWAEPDPDNEGGHILWVAIADVAHYVRAGTPLDIEARKRGNSSYFPDRVVPMLPDHLSGDLCSLHEGVPRPVIYMRARLDAEGNKLDHKFGRAMIKSAGSLAYEEVQAARDGNPNERCAEIMENVINPLYETYEALKIARKKRQPLDLDLPERKIELSEDGKVTSVQFRDRFDAHKMIEEFMVLANVAAAETLIAKKTPLIFRVHEEPERDKLEALRDTAKSAGFNLAKGQVLQTSHLNRLLNDAAGTDDAELINMATLRSMQQAYYSPSNFGHFGLALRAYAHFTSPIRRYADLIVHRALITTHGWGDDGLPADAAETLRETADHISSTERRSMLAERDTTDRYLAAYLSERLGEEFEGRISGIARFGVFVKMDENGADGLVPMSMLGREYFRYERDENKLVGADSGMVITVGMRARVKLAEVTPITGGIALEILQLGDKPMRGPKGGGAGAKDFRRGGKGKSSRKGNKAARRVRRNRR